MSKLGEYKRDKANFVVLPCQSVVNGFRAFPTYLTPEPPPVATQLVEPLCGALTILSQFDASPQVFGGCGVPKLGGGASSVRTNYITISTFTFQ